ncbi:MAG: quinone oxidoreductase family protein [Acidimicrobiales bacterium]
MQVVGVMEFGGPEALQVVEVPDPPAPGPGEVKIRVHAATVNPTDTYMRNGTYARRIEATGPPYIPGMDAAGEVLEVGPDVDTVAPGDRVMAVLLPTRPAGGAYAEQIVVPAGSVARAPHGTSHAEAATLPMNGLTARLSLDQLGLSPGQTLAVTGAAGSYGGYVIQLAKLDGLQVVADASEADEDLVRGLGADVVVRRGDDVADRIRAVVPDGVDGLADGSVQSELVFPAIRDGGGMAVVRGFDGETPRGIQLHQTWVARYATEGEILDRLGRLAEDGALALRVARTFPADDAPEAHRLLEQGGVRGRLVIEL